LSFTQGTVGTINEKLSLLSVDLFRSWQTTKKNHKIQSKYLKVWHQKAKLFADRTLIILST